ncbi:sugar-binding domain-containing protein [Chryseolinea lacunae]|uniref:beta-galactosidase n=1 Tax=Chryseolinea lacunae TaxID=2801331 RepID=A0ABS1L1J3_9BACT|nr:sugar-binding domain-containing protein [Chryseolinea lacunae]MBL0745519.1 hypothetical protein [Chryseolinea lacunae]
MNRRAQNTLSEKQDHRRSIVACLKDWTSLSAFLFAFLIFGACSKPQPESDSTTINLAGEWAFQMDSLDKGVSEKWFDTALPDKITLPGSMTTNNKGNEVGFNTPWTGSVFDSSWFKKPEYAAYRKAGNIKVPFWLQPVKYYKGAAWYQKTITVPASWEGNYRELFIERSHWETTVWIDTVRIGMQNSLGTPHVFDLTKQLTPGTHQVTIRIDNRIKDFNVGVNSHSISDHTQGNWNGMVGQLFLASRPLVHIGQVTLHPDVNNRQVRVRMVVNNAGKAPQEITIRMAAAASKDSANSLPPLEKKVVINGDSAKFEWTYAMGDTPLLWSEAHPDLYDFNINLTAGKSIEQKKITFGMREFSTQGTQFTINGKPTLLRGTLECAIFPKTGYPPTDEKEWERIFTVCRAFGLNHMRFHSWTPPEAAFSVADRLGFYLQVECSSWANFGSSVGDGAQIDRYLYEESNRVVNTFGNHPSFCMMTYGNEPKGENQNRYLGDFVKYWQAKDSTRLYTSGSGWPVIPENDYHVTSDPRIQHWEDGVKSIINSKPPSSAYDWSAIINQWKVPTVSHEIGQWCVYPDFKEIVQYDGALKARNFEIFQATLKANGLLHLADSFLLASGKLQTLCYKADIEAALRTKNFGGFQLLDLHDFPGQGTALVGVLSPFWTEKGYVTAAEYSQFCNATVPLARFSKMIYQNNETLKVPVEVSHFGDAPLDNTTASWQIAHADGREVFKGMFAQKNIPLGNGFALGVINQALGAIDKPSRLVLTVAVGERKNTWDFFVYPAALPKTAKDILITQQLDATAMKRLNEGGEVLLTLKKGSVKPEHGGSVAVGFSSIFWNTAWTHGQAPHTLGILCDPHHAALAEFPTQYHSNWQWWDALSHADAIRLDDVTPGLKPIVRVIDDWVTAQSLGLIFECRVGKGKLVVSSIDLVSGQGSRPEAKQLLYSLKQYMGSERFRPVVEVSESKIRNVLIN